MTAAPFDPNCIFCRIIAGQASATIRYESDDVVAFDDHYPKAPTHVLICPKGHYPTFLETPPDVLGALNAQIVAHLHYHFLAGRQMRGF
jgi:diadenosine tetraphosphate (Ap4A) HIT family hydrolase